MQARPIAIAALAAGSAFLGAAARANADATTVNYAVMRNGTQIGTHSVSVAQDGPGTILQSVTHVQVDLAFVTLYKFDQTETERWADGHLVSMTSTTNDNGTIYRTSASVENGKLLVQSNGKSQELAPTTIPFNLWNTALIAQNSALDTKKGNLEQISVVDRGEDNVVVHGREQRAHHFQIVATFPQDVWYDDNHHVVQVELKGSDGSTISYQLA